ncbi:hypothetical protein CAPTEDRAFT_197097 [Capitella teleta]|uniref:Uncharacterized protein n=1 Tax=Capitella teleta TaxID=283909 RepID=R7UKW8_CAPTE|nr:hypothetical protein CAPTEDRAFT_197097 [Capitella teleta]|eukprot:ELU04413.1 hypothetical protein CAPTEDRAFT_197097 [Capitella teleta]
MTSASSTKKVVESKQVIDQAVGKAPHTATKQYTDRAVYHGQYSGNCGNDGFYYNDISSFVICSNGNAYIQPCAPGSNNLIYFNYNRGKSYYNTHFCDVNLVDDGYTLLHGRAHDTIDREAVYDYGVGYDVGYGSVSNAGYRAALTGFSIAYNDVFVDEYKAHAHQKPRYGTYGHHVKEYTQ